MGAYEFYEVVKKPPIAWVYLNRAEKKNAMNPPAWKESIPIFEGIDKDPDIRVAVIAGRGPCFSAGIDLMGMAGEMPERLKFAIILLSALPFFSMNTNSESTGSSPRCSANAFLDENCLTKLLS